MTSWLKAQRKQALLDLSADAGLKQDDSQRKDEILEALEQHLNANAKRLSRNPNFDGFFRSARSPVKGPTTSDDSGDAKSVVRARGRPTTRVKEEEVSDVPAFFSSPTQTISTATRALATSTTGLATTTRDLTETAVRRVSQRLPRASLPGPASPADVADQVEIQAQRLTAGLSDLWSVSGVPERLTGLRERCSTIHGVTLTTLFVEACGLGHSLLPRKYLFDIPWVPILGMPERLPIWYSDMFSLLSGKFWTTALLWSATSIFIPMLFGYFYNLTFRDVRRRDAVTVAVPRHEVDPLTFHVVKALVTYLVYTEYASFGFIDPFVVDMVKVSMLGGTHQTIMLGSYIGIVASLYEAAQKK